MTKKLTKISIKDVVIKVGVKTAYIGIDFITEIFKKSSTLNVTMGSHAKTNDPMQLAANQRRRTKLKTIKIAVSQKIAKGGMYLRCACFKMGLGKFPSSVHAVTGTIAQPNTNTIAPSSGDVCKISQRTDPRSRFQYHVQPFEARQKYTVNAITATIPRITSNAMNGAKTKYQFKSNWSLSRCHINTALASSDVHKSACTSRT